jgi:hypothetical protein
MGKSQVAIEGLEKIKRHYILSPIIAIVPQGKYYIARKDEHFHDNPDIPGLTHCSIYEYNFEH